MSPLIKILTPRIVTVLSCLALTAGCNKSSQDHSGNSRSIESGSATAASVSSSKKLAIHVNGNKFVNERDEVIQLRGVSLMGMEFVAVGGWSPQDPFPTLVETTWAALHDWKINTIRIPLNEASFLGMECVPSFVGPAFKKPGKVTDPDPGHNYKQRLQEVVDRATQEGLYVVLDLHVTAPNDPLNSINGVTAQCGFEPNPLPDADHSIEFWKQVASLYKSYPNVIFELFNNPYVDQWTSFSGTKTDAWVALRDGVMMNSYLPLLPSAKKHLWRSAGVQQLVNAVRATGATNVILHGSLSRSADLELWQEHKAVDPINQMAASWHAFPGRDAKWGDKCYLYPSPWCDDRSYRFAARIIAANYPVIVTEFGDRNAPGTKGAPFASALLPQLDKMGISYLAWTFTVGDLPDYLLIKDNLGSPTDGYGEYVKSYYMCKAQPSSNCAPIKAPPANSAPSEISGKSKPATSGWDPLSSPL